MDTQFSQVPQGFAVGPGDDGQLSALARMRAVVVFPMPREPMNRCAWPMR